MMWSIAIALLHTRMKLLKSRTHSQPDSYSQHIYGGEPSLTHHVTFLHLPVARMTWHFRTTASLPATLCCAAVCTVPPCVVLCTPPCHLDTIYCTRTTVRTSVTEAVCLYYM
eukprot:scpid70380/ scgid11074/ 